MPYSMSSSDARYLRARSTIKSFDRAMGCFAIWGIITLLFALWGVQLFAGVRQGNVVDPAIDANFNDVPRAFLWLVRISVGSYVFHVMQVPLPAHCVIRSSPRVRCYAQYWCAVACYARAAPACPVLTGRIMLPGPRSSSPILYGGLSREQ
eukprot:1604631-Rhodomonas_salina.4